MRAKASGRRDGSVGRDRRLHRNLCGTL